MKISIEVVITYLWDHLCADIIDPETGKEKTSSSQAFSPLVHQMVCWRTFLLCAIVSLSDSSVLVICGHYWPTWLVLTSTWKRTKVVMTGWSWLQRLPSKLRSCQVPAKSVWRGSPFRLSKMHMVIGFILLSSLGWSFFISGHVVLVPEVPLFHIAACFSAACPLSGPSVALANVCIQRARGTTRSDMANVATHLATSLMNKKELESAMPAAFSALEKVVMIVSHFFELRIGLH